MGPKMPKEQSPLVNSNAYCFMIQTMGKKIVPLSIYFLEREKRLPLLNGDRLRLLDFYILKSNLDDYALIKTIFEDSKIPLKQKRGHD